MRDSKSPGALLLLFVCFFCSEANTCNKENGNVVLDVTLFGAVGDGRTDDTLSIRRAVRAARLLPSPTVVLFPKGKTFLTSPFNMSSCMTLQVDATVRAKSGMNAPDGLLHDWPRIPPLPSYPDSEDGGFHNRYQSFIYAKDATEVHVTGNGTVDGGGDWWWNQFRNRTVLEAGRPFLLEFVNCTNVEVSHVTLRDSPFWCLHPTYCNNVHIHHIGITSRMYAPNADGIDPDSCSNVIIEHNDVSCGDDHIAIKAGRCGSSTSSSPPINCNDKHFQSNVYQTENITVRYNTFRIGMGIAIGSESSGGIRNIEIYDNVVGLCDSGHCDDTCCGWGPALHLKTTPSRGGVIENIQFRNNTVYNNTGFILVELNYQDRNSQVPIDYRPTLIRNISFIGNRALGDAVGANWHCLRNDTCQEIVVINNTIRKCQGDNPWSCQNVQSFKVSGNSPSGLEDCMKNSLQPPSEIS